MNKHKVVIVPVTNGKKDPFVKRITQQNGIAKIELHNGGEHTVLTSVRVTTDNWRSVVYGRLD